MMCNRHVKTCCGKPRTFNIEDLTQVLNVERSGFSAAGFSRSDTLPVGQPTAWEHWLTARKLSGLRYSGAKKFVPRLRVYTINWEKVRTIRKAKILQSAHIYCITQSCVPKCIQSNKILRNKITTQHSQQRHQMKNNMPNAPSRCKCKKQCKSL